MSVEGIEGLLRRSEITREDLAKRMYVTADELEAILSGQKKLRRLHIAGLERATLSLALERRDPSFVNPQFHWQMLRYAMLVLQEQRRGEADNPAKESSKPLHAAGA